jgi:hypothetical protein
MCNYKSLPRDGVACGNRWFLLIYGSFNTHICIFAWHIVLSTSPRMLYSGMTYTTQVDTHKTEFDTTKYMFPTRLLTSEDECKWFWHQMIYFPGTINIVSTRLCYHTYITMNLLLVFQLMHINSLCAWWHSKAAKESSSSSSRRLLISLWVTSLPFLCPELTDAPHHCYGGLLPPFPIWRPHPQGPHTLPSQGTRQYKLHISELIFTQI